MNRPPVCPINAPAIIEYAQKNGIKITRGAVTSNFPRACIISLLSHSVHMNKGWELGTYSIYPSTIAKALGISNQEMDELEAGFEGWASEEFEPENLTEFHKIGQEVASLAGL